VARSSAGSGAISGLLVGVAAVGVGTGGQAVLLEQAQEHEAVLEPERAGGAGRALAVLGERLHQHVAIEGDWRGGDVGVGVGRGLQLGEDGGGEADEVALGGAEGEPEQALELADVVGERVAEEAHEQVGGEARLGERAGAPLEEAGGQLGVAAGGAAQELGEDERDVLAPLGQGRQRHAVGEAGEEVVLERGERPVGGGDQAEARAQDARLAEPLHSPPSSSTRRRWT
jgi:hypothetical protein